MSQPKLGDMAVRISSVGHASPRWKTAKSSAEADRLNQRLSELRAKNIRKAIEEIVRRELPKFKIEVPAVGVGSRERFPTVSEDNAAIDRSVLVTVELTSISPSFETRDRPPRHIYAPSKVWTLKVMDIMQATVGYAKVFLRVRVRNPYTGKEIPLSGWLSGGGFTSKFQPFDVSIGPIGREVNFSTPNAMDFDDWRNNGDGQIVRLGRMEISVIVKEKASYLVFTSLHTHPDMLLFQNKLSVGWFNATGFVVAGKLFTEGENPGDYLELPSVPDIIPTKSVRHYNDGLILMFPTGKAGLQDLTDDDRKKLKQYVVEKAHNIEALSSYYDVSAAAH